MLSLPDDHAVCLSMKNSEWNEICQILVRGDTLLGHRDVLFRMSHSRRLSLQLTHTTLLEQMQPTR